MMGTSLHTLVQMVDNGLGLTFIPSMAIEAGILDGTRVDAKPLRSESRLSPDRADLAPLEPARERVPAARRGAAPDHGRACSPTSRAEAFAAAAALRALGRELRRPGGYSAGTGSASSGRFRRSCPIVD